MATIRSPRIRQQDYTRLSANTVPTSYPLSATAGRVGGPKLGESEEEEEESAGLSGRPEGLIGGVLLLYLVYRLLT